MTEVEIQALLDAHISELREVNGLDTSVSSRKEALRALRTFWKRTCHLARIADSEEMGAKRRYALQAVVKLSREAVATKRSVIAGTIGEFGFEDDDRDGGAGVLARVVPPVPPRTGRDAKPFPPEDLLPDGAESSME